MLTFPEIDDCDGLTVFVSSQIADWEQVAVERGN